VREYRKILLNSKKEPSSSQSLFGSKGEKKQIEEEDENWHGEYIRAKKEGLVIQESFEDEEFDIRKPDDQSCSEDTID